MMKSVFAVLTMAVVSVCGISSAQAVELGVLAGANMTNFSGDDADGAKMGMSYAAGLSVTQGVGPIAVEADLLYVNRKVGFEANDDYYTKANYIQVPVIARYSLMPMLSIGAGPVYSMGMGKLKAKNELGEGEAEFEDANLKKGDLGAVLSLQAKPSLGGFNLVADARYQMGLSSIAEGDGSLKFNTFQLLVGTTF